MKKCIKGVHVLRESQNYNNNKAINVDIEGAVNLSSHPISEYKVRLAYGDLTLIVAVLRDYIEGLDKLTEQGVCPINEIEYECYYRKKFLSIAERISEQIDYDYDTLRKKCIKKLQKTSSRDIGEDALVLALKR